MNFIKITLTVILLFSVACTKSESNTKPNEQVQIENIENPNLPTSNSSNTKKEKEIIKSDSSNELYPHQKFANPDVLSSDNFATIKAGKFNMGSPDTELERDDNEILHEVTISKDFEIQRTVVTGGQFYLIMGYHKTGRTSKYECSEDYFEIDKKNGFCPNFPAAGVTWNEAQSFIKIINLKDPVYQYRLPTEAEWEYSARGGNQYTYWFGDAYMLDHNVWYRGNSEYFGAHPVGTKPANQFGLYEVLGNLYQWTQDWYSEYPNYPVIDPVGPKSGNTHVLRGGSWQNYARDVRSAVRDAGIGDDATGWPTSFRLVRTKK